MKSFRGSSLFLLLLVVASLGIPIAFSEEPSYQLQESSHHNDHLNDESDEFPNNYAPFIIPAEGGRQIGIAPVVHCTSFENDTFHSYHHPCKMAQTIFVDNDWNDGNANYTYIFEDWNDYDWNDIIVNLYASTSDGIFSDLFLSFREAAWKNPFSLEITVEGTWIKIGWNSTDYPGMHSLTVNEGETAEINLFTESNLGDEALVRFLIPPFASFSWHPVQPSVGEIVAIDASESYDPDKEIEIYAWSFGDGTSVYRDNETVTHSFTSPGTYAVILTVIDDDGLIDRVSRSIGVLAIIGGETTSLDSTLIAIWRNISILLIIAFVAIAAVMHRKRFVQPV